MGLRVSCIHSWLVFNKERQFLPRRARAMERGAPRERGRPARMRSRSVPLSFPGMYHPANLPALRRGLG